MKVDEFVRDDRETGLFRIHRLAYADPEVFEQEMETVFSTCWLYLGHESEVAKPGDFVRRTVGGRPVFFIRDKAGAPKAYYNSCTHRGAMICREDKGNARLFQCFYHAWTFNSEGELVSTPGEEAYPPAFDRSERNLRAPRLESYRGFYFINHDQDAGDLETYLAGVTEYLDLIVDQSEAGMRVVPGTNVYTTHANWKLMCENSLDNYHALTVHTTFVDYVKSTGGGLAVTEPKPAFTQDLGNGHSVTEYDAPWGRPIAHWEPLFGEEARESIGEKRQWLIDRYGRERGLRMAETFRNVLIFPNLVINDIAAITIRYMEPRAADAFVTTAWALAPTDENEDEIARRLDSYQSFIGPGGLATPDDVEAIESCQRGFATHRELPWSDMSRGMTERGIRDEELPLRTFWRTWAHKVTGAPAPDQIMPGQTEAPLAAAPERSA